MKEKWLFKAVYLEKTVRMSMMGATWISVEPSDPDTGKPDAYLAWKLAAGNAMRFTKGKKLLSLDFVGTYEEED